MKKSFYMILFCSITIAAHSAKLRLVPTFENCSVYVEETDAKAEDISLFYRQKGTEKWLKGHKFDISSNNSTPRTSLFLLKENSEYEVKCIKEGSILAQGNFITWSENVPVGTSKQLTENTPLLIEENGTPDAWIKYTAAADFILDGGDEDTEAILIENASYIILENLNVIGGKRHGIQIKNSHHIRIKNCNISGFGREGKLRNGIWYVPGEKKPINWDAGIYIDLGEQVVIENCFIHDPRGRANSWAYGHPLGPNAVFVRAGPKGGVVVRYNDLVGSVKHRWNDGIESFGNKKTHGGFRCDSDIYGNFIAYPNDDCIELDGGQQNLRFYGNKLEGGLCSISTAPNLIGPSYIFNNLAVNLGDERRAASAVVKNGGGSSYTKGITYFYNNTFYTFGRGITGVGIGRDKNRQMFYGVSRNNILAVNCSGISDTFAPLQCDYDYDFFTTPNGGNGEYTIGRPMEKNAKFGTVHFTAPKKADFRLKPNSPAREAGTAISGLYPNEKVDLGALPSSLKYNFLPWRKTEITADKYQISLSAFFNSNNTAEEIVTLNTAKLQTPQKFKILKNDAFDWLNVTPEGGLLEPGKPVRLKASFDKTKADLGLSPGAFIVKLESGVSIPITVYGNLLKVNYKQFYNAVECEGAETFKRVIIDGKDCLNFSENREKGITIKPIVPEAGKYYLYYNVKCPRPYPMHDSIFISVNGSELKRCAVTASSQWHWVSRIGKTIDMNLKKGENIIRLCQREPIYIRAIYISSKPILPGDLITETAIKNRR